MTQLNRNEYAVQPWDETHFWIDADATVFDPYISKGWIQKIVGYTEFHRDLVFENVTYKSTLAYTPNSIKASSDLSVDAIEASGILQNAVKNALVNLTVDGISDEDLIAGFYDQAGVELFVVNYKDLTMGRLNLPISGHLGETELRRGTYQTELVSKSDVLQESMNEVYSANCRADLGDDLDGSEAHHELRIGFGCKVRLDPPAWLAEMDYTAREAGDAGTGSVIQAATIPPSGPLTVQFVCTTAGTSGTTEPAWNTTIGGTTTDGTVVWTTIQALTVEGYVHQVVDRRRFYDYDRSEPPTAGVGGVTTLLPIAAISQGSKTFTFVGSYSDVFPENAVFTVVNSTANDGQYTVVSVTESSGNTILTVSESIPSGTADGAIVGRTEELVGFFTWGKLTFLTGKNTGIAREVKQFAATTNDGGVTYTGPGFFELFEAVPFDIQVGDKYEVTAGCDKSLVMCVGKFDNVYNRRAEDNIPGQDKILLYPDAK